jgi:hypothetical protein
MATKSAHILLETNRMAAFLKMVRRGDVSNLARIGPNVSPQGGRRRWLEKPPALFSRQPIMTAF